MLNVSCNVGIRLPIAVGNGGTAGYAAIVQVNSQANTQAEADDFIRSVRVETVRTVQAQVSIFPGLTKYGISEDDARRVVVITAKRLSQVFQCNVIPILSEANMNINLSG